MNHIFETKNAFWSFLRDVKNKPQESNLYTNKSNDFFFCQQCKASITTSLSPLLMNESLYNKCCKFNLSSLFCCYKMFCFMFVNKSLSWSDCISMFAGVVVNAKQLNVCFAATCNFSHYFWQLTYFLFDWLVLQYKDTNRFPCQNFPIYIYTSIAKGHSKIFHDNPKIFFIKVKPLKWNRPWAEPNGLIFRAVQNCVVAAVGDESFAQLSRK